MEHKIINNILKNGQIPLKALNILGYIADNKDITTNELIAVTNYPPASIHRYVRLLIEKGYITSNNKARPFSYKVSDKGEKLWKDNE